MQAEAGLPREVMTMFLRVVISTFFLVFVAELGDKTQLTTMLLVAQDKSPRAVFLGAALALVASSLVGVLAGTALTKVVPAQCIQFASGIAFLVLGILLIVGKF
jgi:putative Ca2+/H+ antiporter (TMEM165/GDT1 family)